MKVDRPWQTTSDDNLRGKACICRWTTYLSSVFTVAFASAQRVLENCIFIPRPLKDLQSRTAAVKLGQVVQDTYMIMFENIMRATSATAPMLQNRARFDIDARVMSSSGH